MGSESQNINNGVYTIEDYLFGCVNFDVPQDAIRSILMNRGVENGMAFLEAKETLGFSIDLLKADLFKWILLGVSRKGAVSDGDNGWKHSDGGYSLTKEDKRLLRNEANAIYKDNGETQNIFGRTKIRLKSNGIMGALQNIDGTPLPRIHE